MESKQPKFLLKKSFIFCLLRFDYFLRNDILSMLAIGYSTTLVCTGADLGGGGGRLLPPQGLDPPADPKGPPFGTF